MDFLTSSLLSGILYDGFKNRVAITAAFLKEKLQGWMVDDHLLELLTDKVNALELEEYGEHVIERKLKESDEVQKILRSIHYEQKMDIENVSQTHSGSGDNIVGNKTVYNK
jgi:hypothetical protein|tara:strand:- start:7369 stop:7701 length:333 start_codon:yes stop_codon:yes gene_type:complete